ncbi:MAG TPA: hypothetical protein VGJ03_17640 [Acidimicrobiales bacterium]
MSRRIDVELTSDRGDGSWTWRAAGAREPRGVVPSDLVPSGAKVGDVLRADADFDLDGVTIAALAPIQEKRRNEAERIEIIGPPRRDDVLVTSSLVKGGRAERSDRRERGDRPPRSEGDRGARADRPPRSDRPARTSERPARTAERRPPRARPEEPPKPKPKRLRPARVHRSAVLEELPPEHRPIAEQVLAGDIPAVRQAIEKENDDRKGRGEPAINGDQLLAIAEKLRPRLRTAEWRDRADAALAAVDEIDLRDLRSVVVAADSAARDDDTRALAAQLRESLTKRVDSEQAAWLSELSAALDSGRAVRALRLSSRPPKAGTILEPALTARLTEAAGSSLTADAPADRWSVVLEAIAFSPVRLTVTPASVPPEPRPELVEAVRKFAGRVPKVAAAFGIDPSAEPQKRAPRKSAPRKAQAPTGAPARRVPPPPPLPPPRAESAPPTESAPPAESGE